MRILKIEEIVTALRDRMPGKVAEETGLNKETIRKIRDGEILDPRYSTIKVLSQYLSRNK